MRRSDDQALPYTEWACAADTTSGRAAWTWAWITKAALFTGQLPSTTSPWSFTSSRSLHPNLLEVHSYRVDPEVIEVFGVAGGDVPGPPFVETELTNRRNAAARRCLRCRRSASTVANSGYVCGVRSEGMAE